jgi:hypothetical protein
MARVYDVDAYAAGADNFRVRFWSDADKVALVVCRNAGGVFDASSLEVEEYLRVGQAAETQGTYDVPRDGASLITVWLVPYLYVGQDLLPLDGTSGLPDRRRVLDLGA